MARGGEEYYGRFLGRPILATELFGCANFEECSSDLPASNLSLFRRSYELISPGDKPAIFVLLDGEARQEIFNPINNRVTESEVLRFELLGINEVLTESRFKSRVEVIRTSTFASISKSDFVDFLEEDPRRCKRALSIIATRLHVTYKDFLSSRF